MLPKCSLHSIKLWLNLFLQLITTTSGLSYMVWLDYLCSKISSKACPTLASLYGLIARRSEALNVRGNAHWLGAFLRITFFKPIEQTCVGRCGTWFFNKSHGIYPWDHFAKISLPALQSLFSKVDFSKVAQ